ncbi:MAG: DNA repair protein RadC [Oscillospiraceae bacterium]|nr:DNA repair protein RadC [Oscillospiraceae bacterium]
MRKKNATPEREADADQNSTAEERGRPEQSREPEQNAGAESGQNRKPDPKAKMRGHRERVRRRYLDREVDGFEDYEVLELLLFYAIPYKDTKAMAKDLLAHFGSLHEVFDASVGELRDAGVTENTAILLNLIPKLNQRYENSKMRELTVIRSTVDAGREACGYFRNRQEESVRMLCLNAAGKVLKRLEIAKGDVNAVHFPIRRIVETAINSKAVSVLLAHNHPGGTLTPSQEDLAATEAASKALETVGIRLLDHLIVSGDRYCSLREDGYL